jgi:hypothetical protein
MLPKRNHLLLAGLLLFLLGVQFRMVESFTLSERSSKLLSTQLGAKQAPAATQSLFGGSLPASRVVQPPQWLGLALMSVGSVAALKSLSMKG